MELEGCEDWEEVSGDGDGTSGTEANKTTETIYIYIYIWILNKFKYDTMHIQQCKWTDKLTFSFFICFFWCTVRYYFFVWNLCLWLFWWFLCIICISPCRWTYNWILNKKNWKWTKTKWNQFLKSMLYLICLILLLLFVIWFWVFVSLNILFIYFQFVLLYLNVVKILMCPLCSSASKKATIVFVEVNKFLSRLNMNMLVGFFRYFDCWIFVYA
jgi:hypothetical protein